MQRKATTHRDITLQRIHSILIRRAHARTPCVFMGPIFLIASLTLDKHPDRPSQALNNALGAMDVLRMLPRARA